MSPYTLMRRFVQRYRRYGWVLVGADFHCEGGAWKSLYYFFRARERIGENDLLVDLRRSDGLRQWILALLLSPRVIVNGLAALRQWPVLIGLLLRRDVLLYLHDTAAMLDDFAAAQPRRYLIARRLLRRHGVLCVSNQMASLYRQRFASRHLTVVYELSDVVAYPRPDPAKIQVVMIGTLNRRKGYPLFAEVAQLADLRGHSNWHFHWVGGLGESDLVPVSPRIHWWGWRESVSPFLACADVLFLSSADDPQPLVCLEALALGKRVVAYAGTGSSEIIAGLPGCRVYDFHEASSALTAIAEALHEHPDPAASLAVLGRFCSVDTFACRLEEALRTPEP